MSGAPAAPRRAGLRILLATDGSEAAGVGVELVGGMGWPPGTVVDVAMAVETGIGLFGGPWPAVALVQADEIEAEVRAAAERIVGAAQDRLARPGVDVRTAVLLGRPATAIVEHARSSNADLIVVGSRGHGIIGSMVLGSVSAEVIDHAPVPVLVARGGPVERIVLAWDGSHCAASAAALLRTWPVFAGASIRVVSVADVEVPWWAGFPEPGALQPLPAYEQIARTSRGIHDRLANDMASELRGVGLAAEGDRREGDAATEILAAAAAFGADLIVMGTHGQTGLAGLLLGSVAHNVIRHASCSVLVVRDPGGPS